MHVRDCSRDLHLIAAHAVPAKNVSQLCVGAGGCVAGRTGSDGVFAWHYASNLFDCIAIPHVASVRWAREAFLLVSRDCGLSSQVYGFGDGHLRLVADGIGRRSAAWALSSDGNVVASGDGKCIQLCDVHEWSALATVSTPLPLPVAHVAWAGETDLLCVWDGFRTVAMLTLAGRVLFTHQVDALLAPPLLAPGGARVLLSSASGLVVLRCQTGAQIASVARAEVLSGPIADAKLRWNANGTQFAEVLQGVCTVAAVVQGAGRCWSSGVVDACWSADDASAIAVLFRDSLLVSWDSSQESRVLLPEPMGTNTHVHWCESGAVAVYDQQQLLLVTDI